MSLFYGLSAFPITPADQYGRVDTSAVAKLVARIRDAKADSIGLLGSTGAYAFLTREERLRTVEAAVAAAGNDIPLIVGVGALRTTEAQQLARDAREAGAAALLLAPVSYVPLRDHEVYEHYAAVADAGQLPLVIYNNPGTTRFSFSRELIARLAGIANVDAVKMPLPGDGDFVEELAAIRSSTPSTFTVGYSGDWDCAASLLAGGDTWYSVVGGLLPAEALALTRLAQSGDVEGVDRLNAAFEPLWSLFKEFGSFRVMYVIAELLDICKCEPPRPVLPVPAEARERVRSAVAGLQTAVSAAQAEVRP